MAQTWNCKMTLEVERKEKRNLNTIKCREIGRLSLNYKYCKEELDQCIEVVIHISGKAPWHQ